MAGDFVEADRVDDDFALGDAHRQHLADVRPGHGVEVQPMGDEAFDVDVAIDDQGRVEVAGGQRQQLRPFAFVAVARRFLEVAQDARIGDVRQPPGRHLVEMLQRLEGAAVEQVGFDVVELASRLFPWSAAGGPGTPGAGSRSAWRRPGTSDCTVGRRRRGARPPP